jgi:RNA polymerase sigma factor (sigma-70 family)
MIAMACEATDDELFEQFVETGSNQALEQLVLRFHRMLIGYLVKRNVPHWDAEDIVQDCWLRLLIERKRPKREIPFRWHIFNRIKDEQRRRSKLSYRHGLAKERIWEYEKRHYAKPLSPPDDAQPNPKVELLRTALTLRSSKSLDLMLRMVTGREGLRQIMESTGLKKGTITNAVNKQLKRLRRLIENGRIDFQAGFLPWTPERIMMLGTMSDKELALQFGVCKSAISHQRYRRDIPNYGGSRPNKSWTKEEVALLGTAPDPVIAKQVNRKPNTVTHKRNEMGIPSYSSQNGYKWRRNNGAATK